MISNRTPAATKHTHAQKHMHMHMHMQKHVMHAHLLAAGCT